MAKPNGAIKKAKAQRNMLVRLERAARKAAAKHARQQQPKRRWR